MARYDYGHRRGGGYWRGDWSASRPPETRGGHRDDWWLGGHHPGRYDESYDRAFREFDERHHPRYSPVGGTYHAMGGSYQYRRPPRPLRDDMWFSDWTRWF